MKKPIFITVPFWSPVPWYGFGAITLYPFILFRSGRNTEQRTRRHELIHFWQVSKDGWFRFYLTYLWAAMRLPYREIPAEIEAYAHEEDEEYLPASLEQYV